MINRFSDRAARTLQTALPALAVLALFGCADERGERNENSTAPKQLTLERLYSLPHLIGTAPTGFAWSADSRTVAFLWNDEGLNQREVWTTAVPVGDGASELLLEEWTDRGAWPDARRDDESNSDSSAPVDQPYLEADAADRAAQDPGVTAVAWLPDGGSLAASRGGHVWLLRKGTPPRLWIREARALAIAPDGRHAAFSRDGDVWIKPLPDGSERRVTRIADEGVRVASFRWSPDGSRIAVQENDAREVTVRGIPDYLTEETTMREIRRAYPGEAAPRHRVGVVDLTSGQVAWIDPGAEPPDMILDYRWRPDGAALALDTSDHFAKDRRILVADLNSSGLPSDPARLLVQDADPFNETFYFWRIDWSRDGSRLFFLSDREQDFHLWSVPADGGDAVQHTSGSWAVAEFVPTDDGVVVVGNRGDAEERHLFFVDASSENPEPVRLSERAGTHAPTVSPDGSWVAVAHSADDTPPELLLTAVEPGAPRTEVRVTESPVDDFDDYRWVTPEYVEFESHVDGTTLHGRLTLPPDFDPERSYPAILGSVYTDSVRNQWGGRTAHPTWGLDQYLAQEGYVLLNVDMRGSWGRGREHRRGIRLDYGGMDIEDLESGVRFLGTLGYVDTDRVGIWGSSYGGLMTAMSLFRKPGLYAAGIAGAPATNVRHALTGQMAVMMRPNDQPAEYDDSSPVLHAHGLQDPLMIIHGMRDRVVLYKDSVELVHRLIQLDKDVDLVSLPNAGHGWDNEGLAQTRYAFRKMVDYFNRHVKGAD